VKGYIYVLTNPAMPGLVKIGRSIHGGRKRAVQLDGTAIPTPFEVEFEMTFEDIEYAEPLIHARLSKYRVSKAREFFCMCPNVAAEEVVSVWLLVRDSMITSMDEGSALHMAMEVAKTHGLTNFELINALSTLATPEELGELARRYEVFMHSLSLEEAR
jgi:hypothetical protein